MEKILVTGMSGLIGQAVRSALEAEYALSALNRSEVEGVPTTRASLDDLDQIRPAFDGVDTVIHLAAKITDSVGWDELLAINVVGTRNVLEAARSAGVKRVVFTSSGATVSGWERDEPYRSLVEGRYADVPDQIPMIDETMATRPGNLYASTKVWGESIARHYAYNHGLEVVSLRIGFANPADKPEHPRQYSVWNSQRDVVQAISRSLVVELPDQYDAFFVLSDNRWSYRSIDKARRLLGYQPQDAAEAYRKEL